MIRSPKLWPWVGPALLAISLLNGTAVASTVPLSSNDSKIEVGRRIYEQGILPGGLPLRAERPEGFILEGAQAAWATCHRRSGMGSIEGLIENTILATPVAGPVLFAPARFHESSIDPHHYVPNAAWARALTRPAYEEATLALALRDGLDPSGTKLLAPMPRYALDDASVLALSAYLRQLTADRAPGDEAQTLHLATVVTPDAPVGQTQTVLGILRAWSASLHLSGKAWRLHVWALSGGPESWRAQLEARYREQPVFALLSGSGGPEWSPVHAFCEANHVPCVLPALEVAPEEKGDFYSMYFSPGVTLEARLIAQYLKEDAETQGTAAHLVQVFSDASGRRAAEALRSYLGTVPYPDRQYPLTTPTKLPDGITKNDVVVLWLRPTEIAQLTAAMPQGPAAGRGFLSTLLAPPEAITLPPAWKARATYASLFDDLGLQGEIARLRLQRWLQRHGLSRNESPRAAADAYAAAYLLSAALSEIRAQEVRRPQVPLNREHLLETLEILVNKYSDGTGLVSPDSHVALYGRMSLGPGQRMAVRGGALLRYKTPESEELVKASDRIVP